MRTGFVFLGLVIIGIGVLIYDMPPHLPTVLGGNTVRDYILQAQVPTYIAFALMGVGALFILSGALLHERFVKIPNAPYDESRSRILGSKKGKKSKN